MKALKILAGIVMALIIGFCLVGILTDSVTTEYKMNVAKPLEVTYGVFMEDTLLDDWLSGFKSAELVSPGDANGVGSKYKMVFEEGGQLYEFEETITAIESNKLFAFELDSKFFTSQTEIKFEDLEGKWTTVTATTVTKGKGFVFKSMLPFMTASMEQREKEDYDKLKAIIESRVVATPPSEGEIYP